MTTCINLKERFGRRFRVDYEDSYRAAYGPHARTEDPWLQVILCHYGHIYPHGGKLLAANVDGHPKVAGRLRQLACCQVCCDGDFGELTAIFDVADFEAVARIIRPYRRRQVSPEQKEDLVARLNKGRGCPKTPQTPREGQGPPHGAADKDQPDRNPKSRQQFLF